MHRDSAWRFVFFSLTLVLTAGCEAPAPEPSAADIQDARRAANAFEDRLHQEVLSLLEREGEVATFLRYRRRAPEMTEEFGDAFGVELRRTAFRVRNRTNVADDWEIERLEALEFSMEAGLDPAMLEFSEVVESEDGEMTFRWIRPIVMTESCLVCHGELVSTEILDMLAATYPDDEATGYLEYELGGAYSVSRPVIR